MKRLILSLLLALPGCLPMLANDGVYFTGGSLLVPVKETDIAVKKETLEITLGNDGYASVAVDYTFYNQGQGKTVVMAFEAAPPYNADAKFNRNGVHPFIGDFTVLFNGKRLKHSNAVVAGDGDFTKLDLRQWKGYGETKGDNIDLYDDAIYNEKLDSLRSFAYAYCFDAPFEAGENTVRHTYRYKMSYGVGREFEVPYALEPATRWLGGQVEDFTLRIKADDTKAFFFCDSLFLGAPFTHSRGAETFRIQDELRGDCLFALLMKGDILEWHATNFAPKGGICIESGSTLRKGVGEFSTAGEVVVTDDGWVGHYLADSGDSYFAETQEYCLVPKAKARVELREAKKGQGYVFINSDIKRANVRQEPSKQSKVLFTIDNDGDMPEYYPCLGLTDHRGKDGFTDSSWYKIRVGDKTGYISTRIATWDSCPEGQ